MAKEADCKSVNPERDVSSNLTTGFMKTILKHLKLLLMAFKEGEAGLHNRLHRERLQKKSIKDNDVEI